MQRFKRIIILGILLITAVFTNAQVDKVTAAYSLLKSGNLDSAKILINLAVADSESVNDGQAWYLRGFIYKSIYKKNERTTKKSPARLEALNSFKRSYFIDTSTSNVIENLKNIKELAITIYNDAVSNLDSNNYKLAIEYFETFKVYHRLVDTSSVNMKQNDIKFLMALASVYTQIYESNKKTKTDFLNLAKTTYTKVLTLDPKNASAYYNMAVLYYDQAVQLMVQSDYDIDIVALNDIQDNSLTLFRQSLPFMETAHTLDPKRREILLGLSGIYFSLNEKEKSDFYKQKLKELGN